jgi:hypothetical protein
MFDLDNPRQIPGWLPFLCFLSVALIYIVSRSAFPGFEIYALAPLPLGILSLSIYLRTRKDP